MNELIELGLCVVAAAAAGPFDPPICGEREYSVRAGGWRTLETFWNAKATLFFRGPAKAQVKVRYGGALGVDRQEHTLDGVRSVKVSVGIWSLTYARVQIKVPRDSVVSYVVCPGGIAKNAPDIPF